MKNRPFHRRLGYALRGIAEAWRRERSLRTQAVFALGALLALTALQPPLHWWAVVAMATALVMGAEMLNSAVEMLIDHLHPDIHPHIRSVKDMAAGMVLVASAAAVVVGLLLVIDLWTS